LAGPFGPLVDLPLGQLFAQPEFYLVQRCFHLGFYLTWVRRPACTKGCPFDRFLGRLPRSTLGFRLDVRLGLLGSSLSLQSLLCLLSLSPSWFSLLCFLSRTLVLLNKSANDHADERWPPGFPARLPLLPPLVGGVELASALLALGCCLAAVVGPPHLPEHLVALAQRAPTGLAAVSAKSIEDRHQDLPPVTEDVAAPRRRQRDGPATLPSVQRAAE
jgi:hypothetical protein